jgi:hypothetical protein
VDFADILRQKTARRLDVEIVLRTGKDDDGKETEETAVIVFQAIGREALDALLTEHAPSQKAREKARAKQMTAGVRPGQTVDPQWDIDTFPPALIAASAVAPPISLDEAKQLWSDPAWSAVELDKLFSGALIVQQTDAAIRLGKGYEEILASRLN